MPIITPKGFSSNVYSSADSPAEGTILSTAAETPSVQMPAQTQVQELPSIVTDLARAPVNKGAMPQERWMVPSKVVPTSTNADRELEEELDRELEEVLKERRANRQKSAAPQHPGEGHKQAPVNQLPPGVRHGGLIKLSVRV